LLSLNINLDI